MLTGCFELETCFYVSLSLRLCSGVSNRILSLHCFCFLWRQQSTVTNRTFPTHLWFSLLWQLKLITGCPCRCLHMTCYNWSDRWMLTVHMWIHKTSWTRGGNKFFCKSQVSGLKWSQVKSKVPTLLSPISSRPQLSKSIHIGIIFPPAVVFLAVVQFDYVGRYHVYVTESACFYKEDKKLFNKRKIIYLSCN